MTAEERMLWEQAVWVLRRNTVTRSAEALESEQVLAEAHERAASQRRTLIEPNDGEYARRRQDNWLLDF